MLVRPDFKIAAAQVASLAGVFLNAEWYETDVPRLANYAARHRMLVVMANHAASVGTYSSVGKSMVWGPDGDILVESKGTESALLIATQHDETWRGELVEISDSYSAS